MSFSDLFKLQWPGSIAKAVDKRKDIRSGMPSLLSTRTALGPGDSLFLRGPCEMPQERDTSNIFYSSAHFNSFHPISFMVGAQQLEQTLPGVNDVAAHGLSAYRFPFGCSPVLKCKCQMH